MLSKILVAIAAFLYLVCPIDLLPGIPVDDIIVVILAIVCNFKNSMLEWQ